MSEEEYYHVTDRYRGEKAVFEPRLPYYLQSGEDKKNKRVCVTNNWRNSARSIVLIKRTKRLYIYSTEKKPVNPTIKREELLQCKKIRKNWNDFRLPRDGLYNKEHWFIEPIEMHFKGMIIIPKEMWVNMIIAMGFPSGDPDMDKLNLQPYKEWTIEEEYQ